MHNFWLRDINMYSNNRRISRQNLVIVEHHNGELIVSGQLLDYIVQNCDYLKP